MGKHLHSYQQRVVDEKAELDEKVRKLREFIGSRPFQDLSAEDRNLLKSQAEVMGNYARLLSRRIARFGADNFAPGYSYPLKDISEHYGLDYGDVLLYADGKREKTHVNVKHEQAAEHRIRNHFVLSPEVFASFDDNVAEVMGRLVKH